ncbi:hypothetical protein [Leucothrix arctica]|uniref:Uncharacterized protein n=1 Tax=Leucothrix arctica TaxID=1481894 RepID=A0A317CE66_9GAMM|nr:hypothetical protein [Leucothrix arctica]PWQ96848.1 hypothetical protein DKT75_08190 [Leucothrix arctica]
MQIKKKYQLEKPSNFDRIKNFFGFFVIYPFEQTLLDCLQDRLSVEEREILCHQIGRFTVVRRLFRHLGIQGAYGFTNFHTFRFGKNISGKLQKKTFANKDEEVLLATARVTHAKGEINIQFWIVRGIFFSIEYRSAQHQYHPLSSFDIVDIVVWPNK